MKIFVVLVMMLLGDFAMARGMQALKGRVAVRIAQALQIQKIQTLRTQTQVAMTNPLLQVLRDDVRISALLASTKESKDMPDSKTSDTSDGGSPDPKPSDTSDGGSPDSIPDPIKGYKSGSSGGSGSSAVHWDSGERTAVHWDS